MVCFRETVVGYVYTLTLDRHTILSLSGDRGRDEKTGPKAQSRNLTTFPMLTCWDIVGSSVPPMVHEVSGSSSLPLPVAAMQSWWLPAFLSCLVLWSLPL